MKRGVSSDGGPPDGSSEESSDQSRNQTHPSRKTPNRHSFGFDRPVSRHPVERTPSFSVHVESSAVEMMITDVEVIESNSASGESASDSSDPRRSPFRSAETAAEEEATRANQRMRRRGVREMTQHSTTRMTLKETPRSSKPSPISSPAKGNMSNIVKVLCGIIMQHVCAHKGGHHVSRSRLSTLCHRALG